MLDKWTTINRVILGKQTKKHWTLIISLWSKCMIIWMHKLWTFSFNCSRNKAVVQNELEKFKVMYQTRETVFHRDIQTLRRKLKIRRTAEKFWRNSVWIADEARSRVFRSQSKHKLRSKRRSKFVQIYAN